MPGAIVMVSAFVFFAGMASMAPCTEQKSPDPPRATVSAATLAGPAVAVVKRQAAVPVTARGPAGLVTAPESIVT
jgi:hypothetical protein